MRSGSTLVQEAELLLDDAPLLASDVEFYRRVQLLINRLRDRHTSITLPPPWRDMVAFLPFTVEPCWEGGRRLLIVTKVLTDVGDPGFRPGVALTYWNGTPIATFVERLSWETSGAHPYARIALCLRALTARPMAFSVPPDEDWVQLTYRSLAGQFRSVLLPWKVYIPPPMSSTHIAAAPSSGEAAVFEGLDRDTLTTNGIWRDLFAVKSGDPVADSDPFRGQLASRTVSTRTGTVGYIRIYSFDAPDSDQFVRSFANLLKELPSKGLVIDLRANRGGTIPSGGGHCPTLLEEPDFDVSGRLPKH